MTEVSESYIRQLRLLAQRLHTDTRLTSPAEIVEGICGIQGQDAQAAMLSLRVRGVGLTKTEVEHAILVDRSIIRTWAMRGTLHLISTEDLPWLLALLGPIFAAADRRRRMQLGLDDETAERGLEVIRSSLAARGPQSRADILRALASKGINAEGQGVIHLIALAALQGLVCLGPDQGAKATYVLLNDWNKNRAQPSSLSREALCEELLRRYLMAFAPAAPEDFASWSGLPMSEVRAAWKRLSSHQNLVALESSIGPLWLLKGQADRPESSDEDSPVVRLLAAFDTFWMGYRKRDVAVSPRFAKRINAGGGILYPAVLIDGYAQGIWKLVRRKGQGEVVVSPFESLSPEVMPGLETEAADVSQFLGLPGQLNLTMSLTPYENS